MRSVSNYGKIVYFLCTANINLWQNMIDIDKRFGVTSSANKSLSWHKMIECNNFINERIYVVLIRNKIKSTALGFVIPYYIGLCYNETGMFWLFSNSDL